MHSKPLYVFRHVVAPVAVAAGIAPWDAAEEQQAFQAQKGLTAAASLMTSAEAQVVAELADEYEPYRLRGEHGGGFGCCSKITIYPYSMAGSKVDMALCIPACFSCASFACDEPQTVRAWSCVCLTRNAATAAAAAAAAMRSLCATRRDPAAAG
jgi:hypothetical protein